MIYIAHRGLFQGPDKNKENHPDQIELAIQEGYHCEVDVWRVNNQWWLGHDEPQYKVTSSFLVDSPLWVHAKNLEALQWLSTITEGIRYFWHQNDDFTLTSDGYIWTFPGKPLTMQSIMVMPEYVDSTLNNTKNVQCFGICSDYVEQIRLDLASN